MSLVTTTIYNAPWWTIGGFDYISGSVFLSGNQSQPGVAPLPDYFNQHTVWLAHFQFPGTLLATSVFSKQVLGLLLNFFADTPTNNYPLYFFRPPSMTNSAGNAIGASIQAPGLITDQTLKMTYTYGIGGGSSGLATIVGTFARDNMMQTPLTTLGSATNFVDHWSNDAMVHISFGGTNTTPTGLNVGNMAICQPMKVKFPANKIGVTCPAISGLITPGASVYWSYGFFLIRSEQV